MSKRVGARWCAEWFKLTAARGLVVSVVGAAVAIFVASAGAARLAGGSAIASAPIVQPGAQQFGNTSCCPSPTNPRSFSEWWKLSLIARDQIRIDYEYPASATNNAGLQGIWVYPPATTDFNLADTHSAAGGSVDFAFLRLSAKGEISFMATQTGQWPLRIYSQTDGGMQPTSYDFTVLVKHAVLLSLPQISSVGIHGTLAVLARTPDGTGVTGDGLAIALQGFYAKTWHPLGRLSSQAGKATFHLKLPASFRGQTVRVRAVASGTNYQPSRSTTLSIHVR